MTCAHCDMIS